MYERTGDDEQIPSLGLYHQAVELVQRDGGGDSPVGGEAWKAATSQLGRAWGP